MMRLALSLQQLAVAAPLLIAMLGVKLFVDAEDENYYLEVDIDHEETVLKRALDIIDSLGLELIPEHECEPEVRGSATRIYLAQRPDYLSAVVA